MLCTVLCACAPKWQSVESLDITVSREENREYSFTDKTSGFWYGRTHQDTPSDWFAGWNVFKKRVLSDYTVYLDGEQLKRADATKVVVNPLYIRREWGSACEQLSLVDNNLIVVVDIVAPGAAEIAVELTYPGEADRSMIGLCGKKGAAAVFNEGRYVLPAAEGGFILTYGTPAEQEALAAKFVAEGEKLLHARRHRMETLLNTTNPIKSNLADLDKALSWLVLTMDELITEQQGKGIYAGLPWFNEYWGRDMFIAMPGATLVTGQFDYTKEILKDFSKFQDTDLASVTCGRIPNRANAEGILYNTADGTPRYVIEAEELLDYTGDKSFLADIYPSIVLSTEQSLLHHTDARGYLLHEDADTWMDVKRNGIPGSPRGNRANDIQYLWFKQLSAASHLARLMGDEERAETWQAAADKVAANFEQDFCDKDRVLIYDHLNIDGTPDLQMRPNQLFCFELVSDDAFKKAVTRRCWEELVYPWGVASLAQDDAQFHPQHENWHYYHKDDAYHNGTIWLWNNGIAMQRMIEYGQKEIAWKLFTNMNRQALVQGAVGSLSENADAHPREGRDWVNLSGTFLQAWSNSEQLRVWYNYFLGIRPDLMNGKIVVAPHLPAAITDLETSMRVGSGVGCELGLGAGSGSGSGFVRFSYHGGKFDIRLEGLPGVELIVELEGATGADGIAAAGAGAAEATDDIFAGVDFCKPNPLPHYPCFDTYYPEALTY